MIRIPGLTRNALWTLLHISKKPLVPDCDECPVVLFCAVRSTSQQITPASYCSRCPYLSVPGFNELQSVVWRQKFVHSAQDAQLSVQQMLMPVRKLALDFDHWLFNLYKALLKHK